MIPIVSVSNLVNAIISAILAGKIYWSYRKRHSRALRAFFLFYAFFTLFFLAGAAPQLFVSSPSQMMVTNTLAYIFLFISLAILCQIPFEFFGSKYVGTLIAFLIAIGTVAFVIGRLANPAPHVAQIFPPVVYWRPVMSAWLRLLAGAMSAGTALLTTIMFFSMGYKGRENKVVFRRSMYLGTGMAILFVAAVTAFLLNPSAGFIANSIATFAIIPGLIIMLYGVLYEEHIQASPVS